MNTKEMIEHFIQVAMKAYKRNSRGALEASKLDRHEPVEIEGVVFKYWNEYVMYRMAQYIQDKIPTATVELELNGNDSRLEVELTDEQQKNLNSIMYSYFKENNLLET